MAQIYTNEIGYIQIFLICLKSEAPNALMEFIQDIGIPSQSHSNNAKELEHGKWKQILTDFQIKHTTTEPHSPWQNHAEGVNREVKKPAVHLLSKTNALQRI
jgi:hypothetical protein